LDDVRGRHAVGFNVPLVLRRDEAL
jgi:hypothetical protein